jgi:hypothetical protein
MGEYIYIYTYIYIYSFVYSFIYHESCICVYIYIIASQVCAILVDQCMR